MNDALMLFSIGPVQDFISASRKTKDLFVGSVILSGLSKTAIEVIKSKGGEVIFPALNNSAVAANYASSPNRILARIEFAKSENIYEKTNEAVITAIKKIKQTVKEKFEKHYGISSDNFWNLLWEEQTNKYFEVYCTAQRLDNLGYGDCYKKLEQEMRFRKQLRNFDEVKYYDFISGKQNEGQPNIKCSLFPGFTALYVKGSDTKNFWNKVHKKQLGIYKPNERLSALAVIKRNFESVPFPSTRVIAAGGFYREIVKQTLSDTDLNDTIRKYAEKINDLEGKFNLHLERASLPSLEMESQGNEPLLDFIKKDLSWQETVEEAELTEDEGVKELVAERKKLASEFEKRNILKPVKYYAVFMFDGDSMGELLSGEKKIKIDETAHKSISTALRKFSQETIPGIIEGNIEGKPKLGKIIYSGGDDLLAFASLDDLFCILNEVNAQYRKILFEVTGIKDAATISAGVAIAHYKTSLKQALESCREALRSSKENSNRDSITFAVLRRSGEVSNVGTGWMCDGDDQSMCIKYMRDFAQHIIDENISANFVYNLRAEHDGLTDGKDEMIIAEIKRLAKRNVLKKAGQNLTNQILSDIELFYNMLNELRYAKNINPLLTFTGMLETSQFIATGGKDE